MAVRHAGQELDDGRWALTGTIAEPAASVRERRHRNSLVFEVVTGAPDGSGQFASHGHTLRLTLVPASTP